MAARYKATINQRSLIAELTSSDPILKRVAEQVMREAFFDPAVQQMQEEFEAHDVTTEIMGGKDASNLSNTLEGSFREEAEKGDVPPNLWGFIGFDAAAGGPGEQLAPIRQRLDPRHPEGPKMEYRGRDKHKLTYRWEIKAPSEEAIWDATSFPWAEGLSWVKRMEQGIPGIGHFLNVGDRPSSRSGGGIQVDAQVRSGRFKPTSYLTKILNNFLRRAGGREANGRAV
jgi:hypothetical protein